MLRSLLISIVILTIFALPLLHGIKLEREFRNFRVVVDGQLYRSGQMTRDGFIRTVNEYGIRTVISFRDTKQEGVAPPDQAEDDFCQKAGIRFFRLSPLNWSAPDGSVPAQKNVADFLRILEDPSNPHPVLIHCFAGIHRTGVYTAVYRMEFNGWTAEESIAEMRIIAGDRDQFENDVLDFIRNYKPTGKYRLSH